MAPRRQADEKRRMETDLADAQRRLEARLVKQTEEAVAREASAQARSRQRDEELVETRERLHTSEKALAAVRELLRAAKAEQASLLRQLDEFRLHQLNELVRIDLRSVTLPRSVSRTAARATTRTTAATVRDHMLIVGWLLDYKIRWSSERNRHHGYHDDLLLLRPQ